ncbi:MAG: transmembrane domain-containing protein [Pleurocapsa sp. SU_196_0]|nr:transmembrane domain-containing protein [Pleurocapsa sp. SU_196_0]
MRQRPDDAPDNPSDAITASATTHRAERVWSNPSAWESGKVPVAGEDVTIPTGKVLTLDVSPPALKSLKIEGGLKFDNKDLELTAGYIMVHGGQFQIGSQSFPFTKNATITLTGANTGADNMGMGEKFLGAMNGGQIDFHGQNVKSWTRLSQTAVLGANTINVDDATGWKVGDRIAIASTDYNSAQAEEANITAISGNTLTLDAALKYMHFGQTQLYSGKTLESRAEVALLRRNVVIRGEETSSAGGFGGHVMMMDTAKARFSNVEFTRLGQLGVLKRYPIHYHMQGDAGDGSYVNNSVMHHTFNRAITIHSTGKLLIQNNAAFDTVGHTYFLEDGGEVGNTLEGNLGFKTRCTLQKDQYGNQKGCYALKDGETLLPTDKNPATFWITNPANAIRNNVAAGSDGTGFWIALPERPTGPSATDARFKDMLPRRTALGEFKGNIAHSNGDRGLNVDGGPNATTLQAETTSWTARVNPADTKSAIVPVVLENFTAYRNRDRGVWLRGSTHTLLGAMLADNAIGATFASNESFIQDSVVVGETANKGNPSSYEISKGWVGVDGRSLPFAYSDAVSKFPIRGYEFYDGKVGAKNVTFENFQSNALRPASALSYLRFTAFHIDPGNAAEGLTFKNANRVYLKMEKPEPTAPNDDGMDGYRSAVFLDKDGSVTGSSGRSVVVDNPFLVDGNCAALNADWQARVCNNQYGRFTFRNEAATKDEISPVTLTRLEGTNPQHKLWGTPNDAANTNFESRVIVGRSIKLELSGAVPSRFKVSMYDRNTGDWLRVSMPWSAAAPSIYRDYWIDNRNKLAVATSLTDLEASTGDKFFLENGTLHLKLQVKVETNNTKDYALLDVCQTDLCK